MTILYDYLIEYKKHKRRRNLLLIAGVVLAQLFFLFANFGKKSGMEEGWKLMFYNMPIMNSLFFPVVCAALASRLMDFEHKGDMLKCLYTFSTPKRLFFTKYLYGALSVFFLIVLQCAGMYVMMGLLNFPRNFEIIYMLHYGLVTFLICMTLFSLQLILAFFVRNQAVGISVGLIGSFMGLFSAFLPESLFQKIFPWGSFTSSSFITMNWDRETGETEFVAGRPEVSPILIQIGWIVLLIVAALLMLRKVGVEESERKRNNTFSEIVKVHNRPAEFMKLKGSPAWYAFFIVPVIAAIIGTLNYSANIEILTEGWYSLWTQHTLFVCYFFMPVIIGIFAGCIWRVEHAGTNMNILLTHEKSLKIVLGKFGATCAVTILSILWIAALYIMAGLLVHVDGTLPTGLMNWLIMGMIGACAVCAFQILVSLVIRNFVIPIGIAFLGGMAGIGCMAKGYYYLTPFSLFDLAMNQRDFGAEYAKFGIAASVFIILFLTLSVVYLKRSDVKTME
ncbi:MAG: ABC transporter permease [Lachnospiraceae bacterium]|nr:ABC transporter permease [Lachnospiraceae bacterium]